MKVRNEPEGVQEWVMEMEGRRPIIEGRRPVMDERRVTEGLRLGERGAGEPGWTSAAQEAMAENVLERRRMVGPGTGGRGRVGRDFWAGVDLY